MLLPKDSTPLDPDELEGLKFPHIQTRIELDQVEQSNIQDGLKWLSRQRKYKNFLNRDFICELHTRLFGQVWAWAGQFRLSDKNIGVDKHRISVELKNLLDDAKHWSTHSTYSIQEFAIRLHHRLVYIHPFPNGNGRLARIFTDVVLEKELNASVINWGSGDLLSNSVHRENYITALKQADTNNYLPLKEFMFKR